MLGVVIHCILENVNRELPSIAYEFNTTGSQNGWIDPDGRAVL
jgi:hypothetical protein